MADFKKSDDITKTNGFIFFILFNIFASPFTWIVSYAFLNLIGFLSCILLSVIFYKIWKSMNKEDDIKLIFKFSIKNFFKKYDSKLTRS